MGKLMGVLDSMNLTVYGGWAEDPNHPAVHFTQEELNSFEKGVISPGKFGLSLKVYFKGGNHFFLDLSTDSTLCEGTIVDLSEVEVVTLIKRGCKPCYRARCKVALTK